MLIAAIEDKRRQCEARSCMSHTAFLDIRQCAEAELRFKNSRHVLYGGYEDAERRIMIFLPNYESALTAEDDPLEIMRVSAASGGKKLSHRDYLGSLLALGIDRSVIGDILVSDDGADIIILKSMGDFLLSSYDKAGHSYLKTELLPIAELNTGNISVRLKRDTVASLRLDNLIGSAFDMSRSKAQEAVSGGRVFVNGLQCVKPDKEIREGDRLVLRGRGKAVLLELGQTTKKGRIAVRLELYI